MSPEASTVAPAVPVAFVAGEAGEAWPAWARPLEGGVTAPEGFRASGLHAGIKRQRPDVALLVSERPAAAAGTFTRNQVKAAPLLVDMEHLRQSGGRAQAVFINSGNANACTGPRGMQDAARSAAAVAVALGVPVEEVLVASTGVIGVPLPVERLLAAVPVAAARLSREGGAEAARAILTTDTRPKEVAVAIRLGPQAGEIRIGGMAKGSGMIHPQMATMLAFVTTDAAVAPGALQETLRGVVDETFNMITVDGDTSTNDMVLALANGMAQQPPLVPGTVAYERFTWGLRHVCRELARAVARDGEGATRLVTVTVQGAETTEQARAAARSIARSNLVKTAVFGQDPNWGRIVAAAGYSPARVDPDRVRLWLGVQEVVRDGQEVPGYDEASARAELGREEVRIRVDLGTGGTGQATAWTCDLTYDYVRINGSYRS